MTSGSFIREAISFNRAARLAVIATRAPSLLNATAAAAPIPLLAPVMSITLSFNLSRGRKFFVEKMNYRFSPGSAKIERCFLFIKIS
jgi:hypothetical protein